MEEFLAPNEVNTGIEVLEAEGFSETGLEVSLAPLVSLDGLAAWKETAVPGQREEGGPACWPPAEALKMKDLHVSKRELTAKGRNQRGI